VHGKPATYKSRSAASLVSVISLPSRVLVRIALSGKDRSIKSAKKNLGLMLEANHFRLLGAMSHWKMSSNEGALATLDSVCHASSGAPRPEQSVAMRMARRHRVRPAPRVARAAQAVKAASPADDDAICADKCPRGHHGPHNHTN
jgi:hypothetical protein